MTRHLIFIHGALGSSADLAEFASTIDDDFQVHNIDLPGHAGQPMPAEFSIPSFVEHVAAYCRTNKIEQASIFGYSMGGYIALCLAKQHPSLVQKIITLGTKFGWNPEVAATERKRLRPGIIIEKVPAFAEQLRQQHGENWKAVVEATANLMELLGNEHLLDAESLSRIRIPVLVLLADKDRMVSKEETISTVRSLPEGHLGILPQAAHPIHTVPLPLLREMFRSFITD